jgi:hypothetical protein
MVGGGAMNAPLLSQLSRALGTAADELISASLAPVWNDIAKQDVFPQSPPGFAVWKSDFVRIAERLFEENRLAAGAPTSGTSGYLRATRKDSCHKFFPASRLKAKTRPGNDLNPHSSSIDKMEDCELRELSHNGEQKYNDI